MLGLYGDGEEDEDGDAATAAGHEAPPVVERTAFRQSEKKYMLHKEQRMVYK